MLCFSGDEELGERVKLLIPLTRSFEGCEKEHLSFVHLPSNLQTVWVLGTRELDEEEDEEELDEGPAAGALGRRVGRSGGWLKVQLALVQATA